MKYPGTAETGEGSANPKKIDRSVQYTWLVKAGFMSPIRIRMGNQLNVFRCGQHLPLGVCVKTVHTLKEGAEQSFCRGICRRKNRKGMIPVRKAIGMIQK